MAETTGNGNNGGLGRTKYECAICLEPFTRKLRAPISLNCGHTFCRECVGQLYSQDGQQQKIGSSRVLHSLICSFCRAVTYSPLGRMKKNVMLLEMLEERKELVVDEQDADGGDQPSVVDETFEVMQRGPFGRSTNGSAGGGAGTDDNFLEIFFRQQQQRGPSPPPPPSLGAASRNNNGNAFAFFRRFGQGRISPPPPRGFPPPPPPPPPRGSRPTRRFIGGVGNYGGPPRPQQSFFGGGGGTDAGPPLRHPLIFGGGNNNNGSGSRWNPAATPLQREHQQRLQSAFPSSTNNNGGGAGDNDDGHHSSSRPRLSFLQLGGNGPAAAITGYEGREGASEAPPQQPPRIALVPLVPLELRLFHARPGGFGATWAPGRFGAASSIGTGRRGGHGGGRNGDAEAADVVPSFNQ